MIEVFKNLFVGNEEDCKYNTLVDMAVIHACKYPCHANAVGYRGNLSKSHPYYLILEKSNHLFLNMVDMEQELHPMFTNPIMLAAMNFIKKKTQDYKVLIHCNQGISRSPSIALLYLSKQGFIANTSFVDASNAFIKLYPYYQPGKGIAMYLNRNWHNLIQL